MAAIGRNTGSNGYEMFIEDDSDAALLVQSHDIVAPPDAEANVGTKEDAKCVTGQGSCHTLRKGEALRQRSRSSRATFSIFQSVGLLAVYDLVASLCKWRHQEDKKMVFGTSWLQRVLRCAFYLVPVIPCIVLLSLNLHGYYIGGELSGAQGQDASKLAALQFAAKVHELLMIASLVSVLVAIVRYQLAATAAGIPFGLLFSPQQIQSIDILWSPELWGTIRFAKKSRKPRLFLVAMLCCVLLFATLGLLVGPSSAILMRPRLQEWRAGGTPFWVQGNESVLFPSSVTDSPRLTGCLVSDFHPSCPSTGWQVINSNLVSFWPNMLNEAMLPETVQMESAQATRDLRTSTRSSNNTIFRNAYTVASIPVSFVADTITELAKGWYLGTQNSTSHLRYLLDARHYVNAPQPMTVARCRQIELVRNQSALLFPVLSSIVLQGGSKPDSAFGVLTRTTSELSPGLASNLSAFINNIYRSSSPQPDLFWVDDADLLRQTDATLAVAAVIPASAGRSDSLFCCTLDSRFLNGTVFTLRTAVKVAQSKQYTGAGTIGTTLPRIYPSASWSRYLNPTIGATNSTAFATMSQTAGLWSNITLSNSSLTNAEPALEQMLVALLANGLGRMNYNYTLAGRPTADFKRQLLSVNGQINHGGNAFDITPAEKANATKFQLEATVTGYAYASDGPTQKAAMAVLFVYSTTIIVYVIYLLCNRLPTGPKWGTPAEIAALAWNSDKVKELHNTGAGISTVAVFENKVRIMASGDDLQLVMGDNVKGDIVMSDASYG